MMTRMILAALMPMQLHAADTGFGDFMAGTEVLGAKTTELGPNWTVTW